MGRPQGYRLFARGGPVLTLFEQAKEFADDLTLLIQNSLVNAPTAVAEVREDRVSIHPEIPVPLFVDGDVRLAQLDIRFHCCLDSQNTWLAIETSSFGLTALADRTPILRFEYQRDAQNTPAAHLHFHAHRGALTYLLSRTRHEKPHDISTLHLPTGGSRFRPCPESPSKSLFGW